MARRRPSGIWVAACQSRPAGVRRWCQRSWPARLIVCSGVALAGMASARMARRRSTWARRCAASASLAAGFGRKAGSFMAVVSTWLLESASALPTAETDGAGLEDRHVDRRAPKGSPTPPAIDRVALRAVLAGRAGKEKAPTSSRWAPARHVCFGLPTPAAGLTAAGTAYAQGAPGGKRKTETPPPPSLSAQRRGEKTRPRVREAAACEPCPEARKPRQCASGGM